MTKNYSVQDTPGIIQAYVHEYLFIMLLSFVG